MAPRLVLLVNLGKYFMSRTIFLEGKRGLLPRAEPVSIEEFASQATRGICGVAQ